MPSAVASRQVCESFVPLPLSPAHPGMLEGPFRRARAENYKAFLSAFYGRPIHR